MGTVAEVTILLACRDGAPHLPVQLASIAAQRDVTWAMVAGDDGSGDGTWALLETFSLDWPGRVRLVPGPQAGIAAHFLHLLGLAGPGPVAFADQDDLWRPGKLAEALAALAGAAGPALFICRVALWDGGQRERPLPRAEAEAGFGRALVQNIGPGHAMVLNAAAADLLRDCVAAGARPMWHDWWAYQMVLGAGGQVMAGGQVQVLYRQHGGNALGQPRGLVGALRRARRVLDGSLRAEMDRQLAALDRGADWLTPAARDQLARLQAARQRRGWARMRGVLGAGVGRRGMLGRISLGLSALVCGL